MKMASVGSKYLVCRSNAQIARTQRGPTTAARDVRRRTRAIAAFGPIGPMFTLANQRDSDVEGAFARYGEYSRINSHRFPPSAYALATSDWYFGFSSHQAPHDSWHIVASDVQHKWIPFAEAEQSHAGDARNARG